MNIQNHFDVSIGILFKGRMVAQSSTCTWHDDPKIEVESLSTLPPCWEIVMVHDTIGNPPQIERGNWRPFRTAMEFLGFVRNVGEDGEIVYSRS